MVSGMRHGNEESATDKETRTLQRGSGKIWCNYIESEEIKCCELKAIGGGGGGLWRRTIWQLGRESRETGMEAPLSIIDYYRWVLV